ncbi:MAG: hypothetical protein N2C12_16020, partial [Planctomycetales bacterium]
ILLATILLGSRATKRKPDVAAEGTCNGKGHAHHKQNAPKIPSGNLRAVWIVCVDPFFTAGACLSDRGKHQQA